MDDQWHYTGAEGEDVGPVHFKIVQEQFAAGVIDSETYLWHPIKCTAWTLVKDLSAELTVKLKPPPPPPPLPKRAAASRRAPRPQAPGVSSTTQHAAAAASEASQNAVSSPSQEEKLKPTGLGAELQNRVQQPQKQRTQSPQETKPLEQTVTTAPVQQQYSGSAASARRSLPRRTRTGSSESSQGLSGPTLAAANASAQRRSKPMPSAARPPAAQKSSNSSSQKAMGRAAKDILFQAGLASVDASGWIERKTADGALYYHNVNSGALSWDRPDQLKDAVELKSESGSWVWFPDQREGYVPAKLVSTRPDGRSVVRLENGDEAVSPRGSSVLPLDKASLARTEDDLTLLDSLDEGLIIHNIRERFVNSQKIYTWIGTILISINPYEIFPIYGLQNIDDYKNRGNRVLDPHVYVVADNALKPLLEYGENHSILISGESGAGKTWNTKQCLSYITETTQRTQAKQGDGSSIEDKILSANPILEAFGNAKTVRNDNSSRFGRFTEVHFKDTGKISGARIDNFLLEKSRVVYQGQGERNYHIFYQLLSSGRAEKYGLSSVETLVYLNQSGCTTVDSVDDGNEFEGLLQAFSDMGITTEEVEWVLQVVAAILHLGNATFESDGGEGSRLTSLAQTGMQWIAYLLDVDQSKLEFGLVNRSIEVNDVVTYIPLKPHAARDSRNALSKSLYGQVFDWLVKRINNSLEGERRPWAFLGLLDIFGFEIFETNSFEQLCINFTNEKLQQLFNRDTFKLEEQLYTKEGIEFDHIKYTDNQPILDLIEHRPLGLLLTLDDMNRMPRSTDIGFVHKANSNHATNPYFVTSTMTRHGENCFTIKHYAGDVIYNSEGFLMKNKDLLFAELYEVLTLSNSPKTAAMFPPLTKHGRSSYSLGAQFRKQLDRLMGILNSTHSHYIRCVKPNEYKAPREFNSMLSLEQLRYSGVFEAVRIRKQGFPFRNTYERFVERYRCVMLKGTKWPPLHGRTPKEQTKEILDSTGQDFSEVRFGRTMALYRSEQYRLLELLRALALEYVCILVQAHARGFMARRFVAKVRNVQPELKAAVLSRDLTQLDAALKKYAKLCGNFSSVAETGVVQKAKRLRYALKEWENVATEMDKVVRLDVANDESAFEALKNVVWRGEDLLDCPGSEWHTQMYEYSRDMFERERAARLDPKLVEAMSLLERDLLTEVYAECKALRFKDPRLTKIEEIVGKDEEQLLKLQYKKAKELGLDDRARKKEIVIRENFLDRNLQMFVFKEYNCLRDPEEFSSHSKKFWKRDEMAKNMLKWQKDPIKTSLLNLSFSEAKQAVRVHKNLLSWCGDKSAALPHISAAEILKTGLETTELRDEIYCQLLKQLIENKTPHSISQAWKMVYLALQCFAPSINLGNYIHVFVRQNAPESVKKILVDALYEREYDGPAQSALPADSIHSELSSFPLPSA